MIKQKQQARAEQLDSFLDNLAAKYSDADVSKSKKRKAPKATATAKKRKTKK